MHPNVFEDRLLTRAGFVQADVILEVEFFRANVKPAPGRSAHGARRVEQHDRVLPYACFFAVGKVEVKVVTRQRGLARTIGPAQQNAVCFEFTGRVPTGRDPHRRPVQAERTGTSGSVHGQAQYAAVNLAVAVRAQNVGHAALGVDQHARIGRLVARARPIRQHDDRDVRFLAIRPLRRCGLERACGHVGQVGPVGRHEHPGVERRFASAYAQINLEEGETFDQPMNVFDALGIGIVPFLLEIVADRFVGCGSGPMEISGGTGMGVDLAGMGELAKVTRVQPANHFAGCDRGPRPGFVCVVIVHHRLPSFVGGRLMQRCCGRRADQGAATDELSCRSVRPSR